VALAIDERARTGRFRGELTFFRRDGSEFAGEISSSLFRTREGETRSSMVIRDVTERRKAEEALRQSEALLDQMGRVARIGAWQMDLLTRTARWTRGTYDIVEIEPGEPIPGPDEHVRYYLPEHRALVTEAMRALIEESKPLDFEAQLRTAKGTIKWCHANGRAVRDHGRCIMVHGTLQDITERKRADEAIQEQLAELRRWHQVTLGREGRVLGLKKEVNDLLARLGEPPRYVSVEDGV
jgi:PAS domain-containing protein